LFAGLRGLRIVTIVLSPRPSTSRLLQQNHKEEDIKTVLAIKYFIYNNLMINRNEDKGHKFASFQKESYSCSIITHTSVYRMLIHEYHVIHISLIY